MSLSLSLCRSLLAVSKERGPLPLLVLPSVSISRLNSEKPEKPGCHSLNSWPGGIDTIPDVDAQLADSIFEVHASGHQELCPAKGLSSEFWPLWAQGFGLLPALRNPGLCTKIILPSARASSTHQTRFCQNRKSIGP